MVTRKGGTRHRTRQKYKKSLRSKGKVAISKHFQEFDEGDRVTLRFEPSVQKGGYHHRYHNSSGVIQGKRGKSYEVKIKHQGGERTLFVKPVHLQRTQ